MLCDFIKQCMLKRNSAAFYLLVAEPVIPPKPANQPAGVQADVSARLVEAFRIARETCEGAPVFKFNQCAAPPELVQVWCYDNFPAEVQNLMMSNLTTACEPFTSPKALGEGDGYQHLLPVEMGYKSAFDVSTCIHVLLFLSVLVYRGDSIIKPSFIMNLVDPENAGITSRFRV